MSLSFIKDFIPRPTGRSMTPNYLGDRLGLQQNKLKAPAPMGRPIGSLDKHPGARK